MGQHERLIGYLFLVTVPAVVGAQDLVIDLAKQPAGKGIIRTIEPGEYSIVLLNRIPDRDYFVNVEREYIPVPKLDLKFETLDTGTSRGDEGSPICTAPQDQIKKEFQGVASEKEVPTKALEIVKDAQSCEEPVQAIVRQIIEKLTTLPIGGRYQVRRGERLVVVIDRPDAGTDGDKTWTSTFTTGSRGQWRVAYGFNFIPDQNETYHTQQSGGDPNEFVIVKDEDRSGIDFAPSIFFSWYPNKDRSKKWSSGLVTGLGFDFSNPVVFVGYGATLHENVTFTGGVVAHKVTVLAGRFEEGQVIGENLDNSQLTEETYAVNAYIGVAFRFSANPF